MGNNKFLELAAKGEEIWQAYKELGFNPKDAKRIVNRLEKHVNELEAGLPRIRQEIKALRGLYKIL